MFCALAWGRAHHPNRNEVNRSTRVPTDRTRHSSRDSRASSSDRRRERTRNPNLSQASSAHLFRLEQVFATASSLNSSQARTSQKSASVAGHESLNSLPARRLANLEQISRWPGCTLSICGDTIDEEIDPILKSELPKDKNRRDHLETICIFRGIHLSKISRGIIRKLLGRLSSAIEHDRSMRSEPTSCFR